MINPKVLVVLAAIAIPLAIGIVHQNKGGRKKQTPISGIEVSRVVAQCYANNLVPVITRDANGNVIKLGCKK